MTEKSRIYQKVISLINDRVARESYIGEDDFVCLSKAGIMINYHIKNRRLDIENIFRAVKRAQNIIIEKFDHHLEGLEIDIFDSINEMRQNERSKSQYASWIAGIFDGKIRLVTGNENEDSDALYIILTHEIIHFAIYDMTLGSCPFWLDEGLAIYLSQGLSDTYFEKLKSAVKKNRTFPLEILEVTFPEINDEETRHLAYAQCGNMTDFFVTTYGWEAVKSVISSVTKKPMYTVLADMGLNYYLIEQSWKRWFVSKYA